MSIFNYEEGEIQIGDSVCEFCINYNNGERCEKCPTENLAEIEAGEVKCPSFVDRVENIFDEL